jgi:heme-degrading monooxygenase HmoA
MRVWRGRGSRDGVGRYCAEHFPERVLPQLEMLDGFLTAHVLVRDDGDMSDVIVMTAWTSLDAVKAFAGEDYEQAVVEPVVASLLERFDDRVTHYEIAVAHRR